jgi:3-phosphoinositide dependent protein kinase-1
MSSNDEDDPQDSSTQGLDASATPDPEESATVKFDPSKLLPSDFFFGKTLGEGAYARVVHAKFKKNNHEFAIKIMEKWHIKKENKVRMLIAC